MKTPESSESSFLGGTTCLAGTVRGMAEEFDVARALQGGIPGRERAWAFVREVAAAWAKPLTGSDGPSAEELQQAEAALGCSLPLALREVYELLGARPDLTGNQDPLLPASELFVHDEFGGVLVFRSENQGCAFWGVRLSDLDQDDPRCSSSPDMGGSPSWTGYLWPASSWC